MGHVKSNEVLLFPCSTLSTLQQRDLRLAVNAVQIYPLARVLQHITRKCYVFAIVKCFLLKRGYEVFPFLVRSVAKSLLGTRKSNCPPCCTSAAKVSSLTRAKRNAPFFFPGYDDTSGSLYLHERSEVLSFRTSEAKFSP